MFEALVVAAKDAVISPLVKGNAMAAATAAAEKLIEPALAHHWQEKDSKEILRNRSLHERRRWLSMSPLLKHWNEID